MRAIACATGGLNEAHLHFAEPHESFSTRKPAASGFLTLRDEGPDWATFELGRALSFRLDSADFRGSDLHTFDGADYYTFEIRLRSRKILVRDAYNGL
jgi:hypothetical protein